MKGWISVSTSSVPAQPRARRGWLRKHWLQVVVNVAALTPFALLLWDYQHNQLTVNPIQEATFRTGFYALLMLVLSLACTPINTVFGLRQVVPLRRTLGLYAFFYATLHFLIFAVLDYGLDPALLQEAIFEKRYALVGFLAFLILLPLAITSTKGWMKRLGKKWKRLHLLVYPAALLVIVHFVWLVKADITEPLLWGLAVVALLALRLPPVRRRITSTRQRLTRQRRARAKPSPGEQRSDTA